MCNGVMETIKLFTVYNCHHLLRFMSRNLYAPAVSTQSSQFHSAHSRSTTADCVQNCTTHSQLTQTAALWPQIPSVVQLQRHFLSHLFMLE